MTWLDKIIGWIAPVAAARRAQARASIAAIEHFGYDAARASRRTASWIARNTGPNQEVAAAGSRLRARARDAVRNFPYAARAISAIAANAVGYGITARSADQRAAEIWRGWIARADATHGLDWYGLQYVVARAIVESGECLIRFRPRRASDGIEPPMQLQVLEPEYLDESKHGQIAPGYAIQGIQFDAIGRRVGYWLYPENPSDAIGAGSMTSSLVPADQVLHVYRVDRAGQQRGVPWLAPALVRLYDLAEYEDAELVRKKIEACFAAFVVGGDPSRTLGQQRTDDNARRIEAFEPGMIAYLSGDEDVRFATPQPSSGYAEYVRMQLRAIASALNMPYELLTGDLSQTSYSSIRAGLIEFRRSIDAFRWHTLIPALCQPVWDRVMELALGRIVPVTWTPPKWESVDPLKDAEAIQALIRNGLVTWRDAVAELGYSPDEQLAEIAATNQAWDAAGIVLDCDPRRTARGGARQKEDAENA